MTRCRLHISHEYSTGIMYRMQSSNLLLYSRPYSIYTTHRLRYFQRLSVLEGMYVHGMCCILYNTCQVLCTQYIVYSQGSDRVTSPEAARIPFRLAGGDRTMGWMAGQASRYERVAASIAFYRQNWSDRRHETGCIAASR